MTELLGETRLVALVQTALMLPLMPCSIPAGALADMYDRRRIALAGLLFALTSAALLWGLTWRGAISPPIHLGFCFLVGSGMAFYSSAWQSSVAEQVPAQASVPAPESSAFSRASSSVYSSRSSASISCLPRCLPRGRFDAAARG